MGIKKTQAKKIDLQVPIGNKENLTLDNTTKPITIYIKSIYKWAIGVVGIAAALAFMIGGVIWLTAGGNQNRVGNAKSVMAGAVSGLVLALGSYFLLYQIDEDLVTLKWYRIGDVSEAIDKVGVCHYEKPGHVGCKIMTEKECDKTAKTDPNNWEFGQGTCIVSDKGKLYTNGEKGSPCVKDEDCVCNYCKCHKNILGHLGGDVGECK